MQCGLFFLSLFTLPSACLSLFFYGLGFRFSFFKGGCELLSLLL